MKYTLNSDGERLIIFFAGWAYSPCILNRVDSKGVSLLTLYDYTTIEDVDIEAIRSIIAKHKDVVLAAWSFGVFYADRLYTRLFDGMQKPTYALAINGTRPAVDDEMGIPKGVFDATLNGLNEHSLQKFYLRIAGSATIKEAYFSEIKLDVDALKCELKATYERTTQTTEDNNNIWTDVWLARQDRIFPHQNMVKAWSASTARVKSFDGAHFPFNRWGRWGELLNELSAGKQSDIVRSRFAGAMESYDSSAMAQNAIIERLYSDFIDKERPYKNILEIGAGSGNLTRLLVGLEHDKLYVNDLCEESSEVVIRKVSQSKTIDYIIGDAEELSFSQVGICDLIASTSTMQWFKNLNGFFEKSLQLLNSGGELVFSTFIVGNVDEIRQTTGVGLEYKTQSQIESILREVGFEVVKCHSESIELLFNSPIDVLRHLKLTGVNSLANSEWRGFKREEFEQKYRELFSVDKSVKLTYRPLYIKAIKVK